MDKKNNQQNKKIITLLFDLIFNVYSVSSIKEIFFGFYLRKKLFFENIQVLEIFHVDSKN